MVKTVRLGMPFRAHHTTDANAYMLGVVNWASQNRFAVSPSVAWTSLLPFTFNLIWTGALNDRAGAATWELDGSMGTRPIDYFAMIHDDIKPDGGWIGTLVGELEATGADLISAVVPIKDGRGLTSTAVDDTGDAWNPRRLTLKEVHDLPPTFGDSDVGGALLLNTGLWVCRFDRPWVERVGFRQQDCIVRRGGRFVAQTTPEDWDFTRQVRLQGGKVLATRKVGLEHERPEFTNRRPWGVWASDEGDSWSKAA